MYWKGTGPERYPQDSPVDVALKSGPRGKGDWTGFDHVYTLISQACERIGRSRLHLSDFHVDSMADLGSGHEERMKYRLSLLRLYGWVE